MKQFLIILLLFGSCLTGCTFDALHGLKKNSNTENCSENLFKTDQVLRYKMSLSVFGKYLSGILIIKTLPDSSYRTVFINELGMKFFDFEFNVNRKCTVHYSVASLERLNNLLQSDLELLLFVPVSEPISLIHKDYNEILRFDYERDAYYYYYNQVKLQKIVKKNFFRNKTKLYIQKYNGTIPEKISINHKQIDLQLELIAFKSTN